MKKKKFNYADVAKAFTPAKPGETNEIRKRAQLAQATGDISLLTDYKIKIVICRKVIRNPLFIPFH